MYMYMYIYIYNICIHIYNRIRLHNPLKIAIGGKLNMFLAFLCDSNI